MDTGSSLFATVIEDHLELKRRNARLDKDLPLNEFAGSDPFENHPLFKTEAEARREEQETGEHPAIELPQDTAELPVVVERPVAGSPPQGWMETTASQEFSWE
jgi:hypothetical protein